MVLQLHCHLNEQAGGLKFAFSSLQKNIKHYTISGFSSAFVFLGMAQELEKTIRKLDYFT
jgi:hypothetical protein